MHEEIRHLGQAIETSGVKGASDYASRSLEYQEVGRTYGDAAKTGTLDELAARIKREPELKQKFENAIHFLESEPEAASYALQKVKAEYSNPKEWAAVRDAQKFTQAGYNELLSKYRDLLK